MSSTPGTCVLINREVDTVDEEAEGVQGEDSDESESMDLIVSLSATNCNNESLLQTLVLSHFSNGKQSAFLIRFLKHWQKKSSLNLHKSNRLQYQQLLWVGKIFLEQLKQAVAKH